jgi:hypothetical protein
MVGIGNLFPFEVTLRTSVDDEGAGLTLLFRGMPGTPVGDEPEAVVAGPKTTPNGEPPDKERSRTC